MRGARVRREAFTARILFVGLACGSVLSAPVQASTTNAPTSAQLEIRMAAPQNYFSERCIRLDPGATLSFELETPHPVDFNVHHHTETVTEYPVKTRVEHAYSASLALPAGGEYCFWWRNPARRAAEFKVLLRYRVSVE